MIGQVKRKKRDMQAKVCASLAFFYGCESGVVWAVEFSVEGEQKEQPVVMKQMKRAIYEAQIQSLL